MTPYDDQVRAAAARWGVPEDLALAQMLAESGGNPNARSSAGAQGLFQLMPRTAAELGVTNPYDPTQNIEGGMQYLRSMYDRFGQWDLALAAYNAGPTRVSNGIFPLETRSYVSRILSSVGFSTSETSTGSGYVAPDAWAGSEPEQAGSGGLIVAGVVIGLGLLWKLTD